MEPIEFDLDALRALNPCGVALAWCEKQKDAVAGWKAMQNPQWMFWILKRVAPLAKGQSVRLACRFARQALPQFVACYPDDKRPLQAIEAAETWLQNPSKETAYAARAARAAARAADAADAAYAEVGKLQCDIIREIVPCPFKIKRATEPKKALAA